MRMVKILALSLVVLAAVAAPALAAGETSNIVRGGLVYTWVNGNQNYEYFGENIEFSTDPGFGGYLAYEYRFSKLMGLEFSTGYSNFDAGSDTPKSSSKSTDTFFQQQKYSMTPIALALNFHVFGRSYVDMYLGPVIGYYFISRNLDDDFGYGVQMGRRLERLGQGARDQHLDQLHLPLAGRRRGGHQRRLRPQPALVPGRLGVPLLIRARNGSSDAARPCRAAFFFSSPAARC